MLIKKTPHSLSSVQHALTKVEHETNSVNIKTRDYNTSDLKDILRATSTSSSTFDWSFGKSPINFFAQWTSFFKVWWSLPWCNYSLLKITNVFKVGHNISVCCFHLSDSYWFRSPENASPLVYAKHFLVALETVVIWQRRNCKSRFVITVNIDRVCRNIGMNLGQKSIENEMEAKLANNSRLCGRKLKRYLKSKKNSNLLQSSQHDQFRFCKTGVKTRGNVRVVPIERI